MNKLLLFTYFLLISINGFSQLLKDDFEGNSTISTWLGDDANLTLDYDNPFPDVVNPYGKVLKYEDIGGRYANVRFESSTPIIIDEDTPFSLKIYIDSGSLTGEQTNQIALKLQNGNLGGAAWTTQTEILKPVVVDQWQTVTFNFVNDNFINIDENSPHPIDRTDFTRVVLQVNGEDNNDHVTAYIDDFYFEGGEVPATEPNPNDPVYDELIWSDEFETDGALDSDKWFHQTVLPSEQNGEPSWFNGEIQHYTNRIDNSFVEDGKLHLVAKKETFTDQGVTKEYTSARLNSKFAFTYGRVEVRAKLPTGVGTWPAIWTLGKNIEEVGTYWDNEGFGTKPWPACGEIDIMEHWGTNQSYISSAMHTPSSFGGTVNHGGRVIPTVSTEFHTYTLEWYEDRMVFSVDDIVHYTYKPDVRNADTWPFDDDQFILLNTAIEPNIDPEFEEGTMEIEYVRVYQESTLGTSQAEETSELKLFPNPAKTNVRIQNENYTDNQTIEVYSMQGRLIQTYPLNNSITNVDISSYSSGVYLFKHLTSNSSKTYKVIKE